MAKACRLSACFLDQGLAPRQRDPFTRIGTSSGLLALVREPQGSSVSSHCPGKPSASRLQSSLQRWLRAHSSAGRNCMGSTFIWRLHPEECPVC